MMKLKEIFDEDNKEHFVSLLKEAIDNCQEQIKETLKSGISLRRRSIRHKEDNCYKIDKYDTERKPVDSKKYIDEYLEEFRKKNFPNIASRRKSVFCWPSMINENEIRFGSNVHIFELFIKNGAKYFQSTYIRDFFASDLYVEMKNSNEIVYADRNIHKYFNTGNTNLSKFKLPNEIIIEHNGYYAFNRYKLWELIKKLKEPHAYTKSFRNKLDEL